MSVRNNRICQYCGKEFYPHTDEARICPECVQKQRHDTNIPCKCVRCGTVFIGKPSSLYCERCAWEAEKEAAKKYRDEGPKRKLGSIDKCEVCGKEYIVKSGAQRYCPECSEKAIKEKSRKRKREYNKKVYAEKRKENRAQRVRVCNYCGGEYRDRHSSRYCSDYCKREAQRLVQAYADIKRGYNRDVKSLEEKRLKYREKKRNEKSYK